MFNKARFWRYGQALLGGPATSEVFRPFSKHALRTPAQLGKAQRTHRLAVSEHWARHDLNSDMFRSEYIGLNGGADFYAKDIDNLRKEGEISLKVFLEMCREDGVEPRREYSGKFNLRVSPQLHAAVATRAAADGKSLNQWVADVLDQSVHGF